MQQRVRKRYRGKIPSSSGQLPVPVALNAELPTLFGVIIHDFSPFVNTFFRLDSHFCPIRSHPPLSPNWDLSCRVHLGSPSGGAVKNL